ncbi:MAG: tRNA (adenosine(37)-N6)-threonylcarbamoyltransferase complex ATPase subunit type 1 TsaE [Cyclobacteriaceae bacterium]|jgi:tRNA threonylcarbamoyladenosine biosynthesis protein TsaE|nr:tRNA (adenosine(37)-N6)-threonylcarbamoyltransferase complex ATPase subunit type 1 TsaE [Flammeovirgaceae bacterium]
MHEVEQQMQTVYSLHDLEQVAAAVIEAAKDERIWLIDGDMGAGKTTLVKAMAKQLGVVNTVSSPTFSIVNEYRDREGKTIYHFDFYRLKSEAEAYDIGVDEYLESGNVCWIEWSEKIPSLLPDHYFKIQLEVNDPQTRTIHYVREEENGL